MWGGYAWGAAAWASQPEYFSGESSGGIVIGGDRGVDRVVGGDYAGPEGIVVGGHRAQGLVVGGDRSG